MAMPTASEARQYYRCALQRHEDALILLRAAHNTGAVYLAGYGVECILKALILENLEPLQREAMVLSFRGARAHDYEWLRAQYLMNRGARFPRAITEAFTLVNAWSTELRYVARTLKADEADGFLAAAKQIIDWADGRL